MYNMNINLFSAELALISTLILFGGLISLRINSIYIKVAVSFISIFILIFGFYSEYACDRSMNNIFARWMKGVEICPSLKSTSESSAELKENNTENAVISQDDRLDAAKKYYWNNDFKKAADLFLDLSVQRSPEAQFWMGRLYNRGEGVSISRARAYAWWRIASNNGNNRAATALANLATRIDPSDLAEAERFYQYYNN